MPVAIDAPMFSGSALTSTPESCSACRAAASTSCTKRSMRRDALRSIHTVGSKSFSSQAKCTGKALVSNCVIVSAPDSPATSARQDDSRSFPSELTMPMP